MKWRPILLGLLLALYANSVLADQVTPSDRVTTHLNVRAEPNTDSPIVGQLAVGQTAPKTGSVPYWYKVDLDGGNESFVSKAWSRVVPDASFIRLGAWNIEKLGHGNSKDYDKVAQIIESHFDILSVVEVMQKGGDHPGYDALLAELGTDWAGLVTKNLRPNTTAGHAEYYAVLYRSDRLAPCPGWDELVYYADNDGTEPDSVPDIFYREPAYGCFQAMDQGTVAFDFLLAPFHARWSGGDFNEILDEVEHVGEVFQAMDDAVPAEGDLIIADDFNLVPPALAALLDKEIPTIGVGSTLHNGALTDNVYDYVLLSDSDPINELINAPEILDVRNVAASNQAFFSTVSDHLSVVAQFKVEAPDDD